MFVSLLNVLIYPLSESVAEALRNAVAAAAILHQPKYAGVISSDTITSINYLLGNIYYAMDQSALAVDHYYLALSSLERDDGIGVEV